MTDTPPATDDTVRDVLFPRLDQGMTEGELGAWLVDVGETVTEGQPLCEIETAKVTTELESPVAGEIVELLAEPASTVDVGTVIVRIGDPTTVVAPGEPAEPGVSVAEAEDAPEDVVRRPDSRPASEVPAPADTVVVSPSPIEASPVPADWLRSADPPGVPPAGTIAIEREREPASRPHRLPPRRRWAESVVGREAAPPTRDESRPSARPTKRIPLSTQQRAVAKTTVAALQVPTFSASVDVSGGAMLKLVTALTSHQRMTLTDVLLKVVASAVVAVPRICSHLDGDDLLSFEHADLNLLVATPQGLIGPLLPGVDEKPLTLVAANRARLVGLARREQLRVADIVPGGLTLSNLGTHGVDAFNAMIAPPQVAAVAIGRARVEHAESPITVTVSIDHRALNGSHAGDFLSAVREYASEPMRALAGPVVEDAEDD